MRKRAYGTVAVNRVDVERLAQGREGQPACVGFDVGKYELVGVLRWSADDFERPWRVANPSQIAQAVDVLRRLGQGRALQIAMESSGTYGDALRQALHDADLPLRRVSAKAAHDYAEVFDGVPSQHDGKDAAVIAELLALGKAQPWSYAPPSEWEEELAYWVDEIEAQRRIASLWLGRVEGLLARHWPEVTPRLLRVSSGTLLRVLTVYGGPAELAADPKAAERLTAWGGSFLGPEKVAQLLACARDTAGVRLGPIGRRRLQQTAQRARDARRLVRQGQWQLRRLAKGHAILQAQGQAVGVPTACVLWASLGDPRDYHCGNAYRKAMGLNLGEFSSGTYEGPLRISKRGSARVRQWLYFAALRCVQQAGLRGWYEAKKARDGAEALRALVAIMRKLALAMYRVSVDQEPFDVAKLFPGKPGPGRSQRPLPDAVPANGRT